MYFSRELVDCLSKGAQVLGGGGGGREQRGLKTLRRPWPPAR